MRHSCACVFRSPVRPSTRRSPNCRSTSRAGRLDDAERASRARTPPPRRQAGRVRRHRRTSSRSCPTSSPTASTGCCGRSPTPGCRPPRWWRVITDRPSARGWWSPATSTTRCPTASLLMGRGLQIPYLGDRMLDALVVLLVRIHLAGFFWGDCSLSNTLFRRDAGALQAYIIDVETAERHDELTAGQRRARPDDRHRQRRRRAARPAGGRPLGRRDRSDRGRAGDRRPLPGVVVGADRAGHDRDRRRRTDAGPSRSAARARDSTSRRWSWSPPTTEPACGSCPRSSSTAITPSGWRASPGLSPARTRRGGCCTTSRPSAPSCSAASARPIPENVAAVRWLDLRFEPIMEAIPAELFNRLEAAEIFHQLLEHRWYMAERGRPRRLADGGPGRLSGAARGRTGRARARSTTRSWPKAATRPARSL